ncbi:hypothetical protein KIW84_043887 [Lathyrus oleraceus]|uniref:Helitron helicase-like domain-containing protein n=1 Tax=Pisum sativum TaxID=3888 RepID=A0A9D5AV99_PEA|nr:hypothetical protein KIW84_043887 [Pisum sativum]
MTFPRSHFQGTHDSEADPSRITHVNDVALDRNCTSPNQRNNTSQSDIDDMDVDEALENAVISYVNMDARENGALSRRPQESGHAFRAKHNIARNFKNNMMMAKSRLSHPFTCRHCNARLFHHESRDTCCNGGKVSFSRVDAPIELQQLFLDGSAEGKHFRQHIRSYNHVLSFTSIGVHVDENILASGRGIYAFRAQSTFYLNIGGFYPNEGVRPRFLQLYIYDTDNELHNRMQENPQLHQNIRPNDQSMLLNAGRLLQQYVVDNYVKIESGRLRWIKEHQSDIHSELYQGLHDALHVGETNAENIGKRTILPSSFIGGRRDMTQCYEDGMAIVLNGGKPDIFLTMTCNPSWSEITSELFPFQTPQDRPDLLTRIFRSKFEKLKDDVINKGVLGKVKSYMYVTEFQKRGLPHVHMLLVLESNDKLRDPKDYDSMVRAEIPKLECEPQSHEVVVRHMIHGPCGIINRKTDIVKKGIPNNSWMKHVKELTHIPSIGEGLMSLFR